jgi:hypothetical protein
MASLKAIRFALAVHGDGSDTTVTCDFAAGPFVLAWQQAGQVSTVFSLAVTNPSSIQDVTSESGTGVTASISLGVATFTYATAPSGLDIIHGTFVF